MLWILAFHIVSIVMWFAGLFYLPRLFVYHSMIQDELGNARFKVMEKKLYVMTTIGLFLTVLFGFLLLRVEPQLIYAGWFQIKLFLVLTLLIYHFYCGYLVKIFRENENHRSHVFYRWVNEYPTIILIIVVILAVVKP
ncbi:MAG: protoporphyrinogen oxidase HemJ [Gammaproteobacteria bacterium]|nr:protoporphyrinogen oxidase HemJ [Gammaproteobacteria bacterium]